MKVLNIFAQEKGHFQLHISKTDNEVWNPFNFPNVMQYRIFNEEKLDLLLQELIYYFRN